MFNELNIKGNLTSNKIITILGHDVKDWEINYSVIEGNRTNKALYDAYLKILELEGYDTKELLRVKSNKDEIELDDIEIPALEIKTMIKSIFEILEVNTEILNFDAELEGKQFVYGLPELNKTAIQSANYIANPGCFATAIQLALLPLAKNGLLNDDVHINATTGSTGAGVSPSETTHFSWRNNNMSHYKAFEHQHLGEINQSIQQLQAGYPNELLFVPNRGDFARGIFATLYTKVEESLEDIVAKYEDYYADQPFVTVTTTNINMKQVVQTNKCIISLMKKGNRLLITSVIDNLTKGASGQAIQNMNLLFGLEETTGLHLKPCGF